MKKESEEIRTNKSLYAEYKRLLKRAETPNLPKVEKDYTMNMVYRVKSRINFDMFKPKNKDEEQPEEFSFGERHGRYRTSKYN